MVRQSALPQEQFDAVNSLLFVNQFAHVLDSVPKPAHLL